MAFAHEHADFLFGDGRCAAPIQPQQPHDRARAERQRQHDRFGGLGEEIHRVGDGRRDLFRAQGSDALGHQFADQSEKEQHQQEAGDEADLVGVLGQQRELFQRFGDLHAHRLAAEEADHHPQQADPELHGRQEAFRALGQVQRLARAAAGFGHLLQAALARRQHGHFRHGEEAVAKDEDEDDQQLQHARGSMREGVARTRQALPVDDRQAACAGKTKRGEWSSIGAPGGAGIIARRGGEPARAVR